MVQEHTLTRTLTSLSVAGGTGVMRKRRRACRSTARTRPSPTVGSRVEGGTTWGPEPSNYQSHHHHSGSGVHAVRTFVSMTASPTSDTAKAAGYISGSSFWFMSAVHLTQRTQTSARSICRPTASNEMLYVLWAQSGRPLPQKYACAGLGDIAVRHEGER
jgi:hypothetical protein